GADVVGLDGVREGPLVRILAVRRHSTSENESLFKILERGVNENVAIRRANIVRSPEPRGSLSRLQAGNDRGTSGPARDYGRGWAAPGYSVPLHARYTTWFRSRFSVSPVRTTSTWWWRGSNQKAWVSCWATSAAL